MPRKCVRVALVAIFALAASRSAQAQVTVDVTKVNCDQFVHWPAPGSEDTELGVLMEPEVGHGETEVYPRVQA